MPRGTCKSFLRHGSPAPLYCLRQFGGEVLVCHVLCEEDGTYSVFCLHEYRETSSDPYSELEGKIVGITQVAIKNMPLDSREFINAVQVCPYHSRS